MDGYKVLGVFAVTLLVAGALLPASAVDVDLNIPPDGTVGSSKLEAWERGKVGLERASGDTVFRAWWSAADSGYHIVNVDAAGDSMILFAFLSNVYTGTSEHIRLWGPLSQRPSSGRWKWFNYHEIWTYDATDEFIWGDDISAEGGGVRFIANFDSAWVADAANGVCMRHTWTFGTHTETPDTFSITRTVLADRGAPYFVVRHDFTPLSGTDTVRFVLKEEGVKVGNDGHTNDLAWVPRYGEVCNRRDFLMEDIGYCVAFLNVGNDSDASDSTFLDPDLKLDAGSGTPEFVVGFVCFNATREIVPLDVALTDLANTSIPSLHGDSTYLHAGDYSEAIDGGLNFFMRTPAIVMEDGKTYTLEYAVGRAKLLGDQVPPVFPEVVFSDGTVWRCPYTRIR